MAIQNVGLFSTSPPPLTKIIYVHETGRDHQQNRPRSLGPSSPQYRAEITTKQAEITTKQAEITTKQAEFTQAEIAKGRDHQVPFLTIYANYYTKFLMQLWFTTLQAIVTT